VLRGSRRRHTELRAGGRQVAARGSRAAEGLQVAPARYAAEGRQKERQARQHEVASSSSKKTVESASGNIRTIRVRLPRAFEIRNTPRPSRRARVVLRASA